MKRCQIEADLNEMVHDGLLYCILHVIYLCGTCVVRLCLRLSHIVVGVVGGGGGGLLPYIICYILGMFWYFGQNS